MLRRALRAFVFLVGAIALLGDSAPSSASADPTAERLEAARRHLERARAAHTGDHPALANAYAELGDCLIAIRALDDAEGPIRDAYDMRRRLRGEKDPSVASSLQQFGILEYERRHFARSLDYHQQALEIRRQSLGPEHPDVATSLELAARMYSALSDWGRCEAMLREVVALKRRAPSPDDLAIAGTLIYLGDNLRWQNELAEAEEVLHEAVAIFRKHPDRAGSLAGALEALAMLYRFKEEHEKAEPVLREVVAIRSRIYGPHYNATLVGRANLAVNHAYQGRRAEADREFASLRSIVAQPPAGSDLRRLGEILDVYMMGAAEYAHDWPTVERYGRAALAALERNPHDAEFSNTYRKLGQARAAQGDLDGAERYLVQSAEAYERARLKMSPGTKMASFKKTPYEQLALVRLERGRPAEAWEALEAARARVLADQLLAHRNDAIVAGRGAAPPEGVPFTLSRVQESLERDQAIVAWLDGEIYPGALRSWACVIRKSGTVRWTRLPGRRDLAALSAEFRSFREGMELAAASAARRSVRAWIPRARSLWTARLGPIVHHLRGVKQLVIVPSWTMGSFPLGMLVDDRGRYATERFTIVHAPSATVFTLLREGARRDTRERRTALLVGDPPFRREPRIALAEGAPTVSILRSAMRGDARALSALPRLQHSREEIAAVARLLPEARVLIGKDASESAVTSLVRSGSMPRYRVVHFATHALIDEERPQRSGLVLAQLEGSVPDGIVTGAEIQESWNLDADLVTLSACQTAVGRTIFGEGVVGLSYPLLGAGARSLMVSQWKVDDEATALLMERFYQNWLGKGTLPWSPRMNKASALREAKRWLREYRDPRGRRPFAHPAYWAAFILVGDPR